MRPYERDPAAIYAQSFATVRAEARIDRFPADLQGLIIRLVHACGMVEVADRLAFSPGAGRAGRTALAAGLLNRRLPPRAKRPGGPRSGCQDAPGQSRTGR